MRKSRRLINIKIIFRSIGDKKYMMIKMIAEKSAEILNTAAFLSGDFVRLYFAFNLHARLLAIDHNKLTCLKRQFSFICSQINFHNETIRCSHNCCNLRSRWHWKYQKTLYYWVSENSKPLIHKLGIRAYSKTKSKI